MTRPVEVSDVVEAHQAGDGTLRRYPVEPKRAFALARDILKREGADAVEEHEAEGYLLASFGADATSYGTHAGVWITAVGAHEVDVKMITKRANPVAAVTRLTEATFHDRFGEALQPAEP